MRLLFDQNLSPKLVKSLAELFPDSNHVQNLGLAQVSDSVIWDFAKENGYVIVTKDTDFHERRILLGEPPNVIWIRKGNCSTRQIELLLKQHYQAIVEMPGNNMGFIIIR